MGVMAAVINGANSPIVKCCLASKEYIKRQIRKIKDLPVMAAVPASVLAGVFIA